MSQRADESVDRDLLLEFTNEPTSPSEPAGSVQPPAPAEVTVPVTSGVPQSQSSGALQTRLDRLEQALATVSSDMSGMRTELATLVGAIDDIKTRQDRVEAMPRRNPVAVAARPRSAAAILGLLAGVAIGIFGWTLWPRDSMDGIGVAAAPVVATPVAAEPLAAPVEPPPQPAIKLAAVAASSPVESVPAPPAAPARAADSAYVGTLSIDAAPNGEVFIDRRPAGRTPLRVPNLKAGSHLVWIERDGYRRFTRVVQVPADRVSRVWADLELLPAR